MISWEYPSDLIGSTSTSDSSLLLWLLHYSGAFDLYGCYSTWSVPYLKIEYQQPFISLSWWPRSLTGLLINNLASVE